MGFCLGYNFAALFLIAWGLSVVSLCLRSAAAKLSLALTEIAFAAPTTPPVTVTDMPRLRCGSRLSVSRNEDVVRGDLVWRAL